ncbi:guanine nucleotide exchange protein for ADP-robosylation factor [Cladochytrium tenue]|nr:guanine nucleotide exchange protein for ADP-robosylation factor [Cladochytrium tenue]
MPNGLFFDYHEEMDESPPDTISPVGELSANDGPRNVGESQPDDGNSTHVAAPDDVAVGDRAPRALNKEVTRAVMTEVAPKEEEATVAPIHPLAFADGEPVLTGRRRPLKSEFQGLIVNLCHKVLDHFHNLDVDVRRRNISAWKPAIKVILAALVALDDDRFGKIVPGFYLQVLGLLLHQELDADLRASLYSLLARCGTAFGVVAKQDG